MPSFLSWIALMVIVVCVYIPLMTIAHIIRFTNDLRDIAYRKCLNIADRNKNIPTYNWIIFVQSLFRTIKFANFILVFAVIFSFAFGQFLSGAICAMTVIAFDLVGYFLPIVRLHYDIAKFRHSRSRTK